MPGFGGCHVLTATNFSDRSAITDLGVTIPTRPDQSITTRVMKPRYPERDAENDLERNDVPHSR